MLTNNAEGLSTLKLKPNEQEIITTFLEDRSRTSERRRAVRRYRYMNPAGLVIHVSHPGGTVVPYRVAPRDLSEQGMGFLHGNFLYPGSACRIELRGKDGKPQRIIARIARCEHVTGRVHDVGIEFEKPIEIASFVDVAIDPDHVEPAPAEPVVKSRPSYWR